MINKIKDIVISLSVLLVGYNSVSASQVQSRPNVLFIIADDLSYPYASAYGNKMISTPGFDYVANKGALFKNAFVTSPGCSPSRASILTGLYPWELKEAGTHASSFPKEFKVYPDILKETGYHTGYTGKGWGPGDWTVSDRITNPAGPEYNQLKLEPPHSGISNIDYTANFKDFLDKRKEGQPFCFWLGTLEPHRPFENMSWTKENLNLSNAVVPGFLPDNEIVRGDLLDFAVEVQWFDSHIMKCINELKNRGLFDNTIVIVTADNGMAFPKAKANCYDAGIHVPLAICWGNNIKPQQVIDELVSLVDVAPTLMDVIGINSKIKYSGTSLLPLLKGVKHHPQKMVFAGRERHSFSRFENKGYPMRCIRTENYLLIHNYEPERWPAGDPTEIKNGKLAKAHQAYYDIDDAPSKEYLLENYKDPAVEKYFKSATSKRPEFELFDIRNDEDCMTNLASEKRYTKILYEMKKMLNNKLQETKDIRIGAYAEVWETYPRLEGKSRVFPKP
ncbi:sulfatase [Pseudopedobacter saltans DSM 12145]|uniref:Sulfatase n=1 Tax=Pseudopedobacter saltans (strain ATCC 51119 / DSM 12145 / JCM 21818 / CCUG 39354 / LMG 10337 / NBRC 100064 / NCIMB 13643) TaxID=762903 RepID=F0SDG1_PSESL|nr:sulfatase [Pseudopedobacter saltans]ADY53944.1 sulfatase [Pseudopedobacter saltans DSM 12145]